MHREVSARSLVGLGDPEAAARAYAALGMQPLRVEILRYVLSRTEVSTAEVMREFGLTRNGVTRHLQSLGDDGLLTRRQTTHPRGAGPITYWAAIPDEVVDLVDRLLAHLGCAPVATASRGEPSAAVIVR